jgi:enoyl-CoA hydratase
MSTTTTQSHRLGIEVEQQGRVLLARVHGGPRGEFGREIPETEGEQN